jgi:hypothetical protein
LPPPEGFKEREGEAISTKDTMDQTRKIVRQRVDNQQKQEMLHRKRLVRSSTTFSTASTHLGSRAANFGAMHNSSLPTMTDTLAAVEAIAEVGPVLGSPSFLHLKVDIAKAHNARTLRTTGSGSSLVAAIRTVTITMPRLFRDIIAELMARYGNLDVVEELGIRDGLEERLRALAPDLILIGFRKGEGDEIGLQLVRLLPNAKVIAFSSEGRHAFVYRMQLQRTVLLEVSPQMLIDTVLGS